MNTELKPYKLFFESVVAIVSAPIVFWCQVPIFIFSLRETPVFLILLTFFVSLFLSLSVQIYRFKFFRMIAALYVLCVLSYLAFVTYGILEIGWWKFLGFALYAIILGFAINRWRLASWGVFLALPFSTLSSFNFTLVLAMVLLLVCYRFFSRKEAVMAALFVYSFLLHAQLLHFFTKPISERPSINAEVLLKGSSFGKSQPFNLEIISEETLGVFYPWKALVLLDMKSGATKFASERITGLKRVGISWANRIAIGYSNDEKAVFVVNIESGKMVTRAELGLDVDFTGFFGDLGFAVDSESGAMVFFEPSGISIKKRLEIGRGLADVCASGEGVVLVSRSGEVFWIGSNLEQKLIADLFGYFWFSCATLGDGRFAVASPTIGTVAIVQDGNLLRSIFAGAGVWTMAYVDNELYVGNLFSGKVQTYNMSDWKISKKFKTCRRLKAMAVSDKFLFASTQCGLLKISAF